ncbi:hypothetical protein AURDEDRAFT_178252 [Auricularia subglabra TFB-10046 SS5]|uniref:Uncharacterized protein n=1 Tax=Auricularia subglabra (strain TFB-10046 / SS5) TaxID=717982 RepID=J0L8H7_AURST|nr:hypothetical protein AURDEDRAFT_178252 [Auricularia subglabra TFB-10046 SS5]
MKFHQVHRPLQPALAQEFEDAVAQSADGLVNSLKAGIMTFEDKLQVSRQRAGALQARLEDQKRSYEERILQLQLQVAELSKTLPQVGGLNADAPAEMDLMNTHELNRTLEDQPVPFPPASLPQTPTAAVNMTAPPHADLTVPCALAPTPVPATTVSPSAMPTQLTVSSPMATSSPGPDGISGSARGTPPQAEDPIEGKGMVECWRCGCRQINVENFEEHVDIRCKELVSNNVIPYSF